MILFVYILFGEKTILLYCSRRLEKITGNEINNELYVKYGYYLPTLIVFFVDRFELY